MDPDMFGQHTKRGRPTEGNMVKRMYVSEAGYPIRLPDGRIVTTQHIALPVQEFLRPGRESSFSHAFARPVPTEQRGNRNYKPQIRWTSDPEANYRLYEELRVSYTQKTASLASDFMGWDPDAVAGMAMKRVLPGANVRVRTGSMKTVADPDPNLIPRTSDGKVWTDFSGKTTPPDLVIPYKIHKEVDGTYKLIVSPLMSRFTLDFDGDMIYIREFRIKIKGQNVNLARISKAPYYNIFAGFEKAKGTIYDSLKFMDGIKGQDLVTLFGEKELQKRLEKMDPQQAATILANPQLRNEQTRIALKEAVERRRNIKFDIEAVKEHLAAQMKPDLIGQAHNRSAAMQVELAEKFLTERAAAGEQWAIHTASDPNKRVAFRAVFGRFYSLGAGEDIMGTGLRRDWSEKVIKAVARGKGAKYEEIPSLTRNRGFKGVEKTRMGASNHILSQTPAQMLEWLGMGNAQSRDTFAENFLNFVSGVGADEPMIGEIGGIQFDKRIPAIPKMPVNERAPNIIQEMLNAGDLRVHDITVRDGGVSSNFRSGLYRVQLFEKSDPLGEVSPVKGGMTDMFEHTQVKFGVVLPGVHTFDDTGNYQFLSGQEFMEREMRRNYGAMGLGISDYKSGFRLPGQAAGRFEAAELTKMENRADFMQLVRGANKYLQANGGKRISPEEAMAMIKNDPEGVTKLVRMYDRAEHRMKYEAAENFMESHLDKWGVQVNYRLGPDGRPMVTQLDRELLGKFHLVDMGFESLHDVNDAVPRVAALKEALVARARAMGMPEDQLVNMLRLNELFPRKQDFNVMRALITKPGFTDAKREFDAIKQGLGGLRVSSNVAHVQINRQKLLDEIRKKIDPNFTLEQVNAMFGSDVLNGARDPGEGMFLVGRSMMEKADKAWQQGEALTPGYAGYDPATKLPRHRLGKAVGPYTKTEITQLDTNIFVDMNNGERIGIDAVNNIGNWRGDLSMMDIAANSGQTLDFGQADLGINDSTVVGHLKFEGHPLLSKLDPIPVHFLEQNSLNYMFTAKPEDQEGGRFKRGISYREVNGVENTEYEIGNIVADYRHTVRKLLGRPLRESEERELVMDFAGRVQQEVHQYRQSNLNTNRIVPFEEAMWAWDDLERVAGNKQGTSELAGRALANIARASSIKSAERLGMLDAASYGMKLLSGLL